MVESKHKVQKDEFAEVKLMVPDLGQVYVWLVTGLLLGFIVARMVRGWGFRTTTNAALGLVSGLAGGGLVWFLGRYVEDLPLMRFSFTAMDILAAAVSATVMLVVFQFIRRAG